MKINFTILLTLVLAGITLVSGCKKEDENAPAISLNGLSEITIDLGETFNDPGASANDEEDGDLTKSVTVTGTVDNQKVGTYTLKYNVSDEAGNPATEVTRTVKVRSNKLAGSYKVTDVVTGSSANGTYNYDVDITQSSTDYNKILIGNFGGFSVGKVSATVEGNSITIPSQSVTATAGSGTVTVTLSGTGTYDGATFKVLTLSYSASNGLGNGQATLTKQ